MKVLVAMSGGVDSSVSAYLLKEQGYNVVGVTFQLWEQRGRKNHKICCSVEASDDARRVCDNISIEHISIDVREVFANYVIEKFCDSYTQGFTPNPCIDCNNYIKFTALMKKAQEIGADKIATGHYARTGRFCDRTFLLKGRDERKDQSYVLYVLKQKELSVVTFPVGEYLKDEIRMFAKDAQLGIDQKGESQDICFVGHRDYADFIKELYPEMAQKGPIVDKKGVVLGEHSGIASYTIGQRKGLGLAQSDPLYVIDIDSKNNTLIVGKRDDALKKTITVSELNWILGQAPDEPLRVRAKIRSTMTDVPAAVIPQGSGRVKVDFEEPQWAPAPGQSAVFYHNEVVIGGGKIVK
jgi:tRNA-specific 2-thiouridylase